MLYPTELRARETLAIAETGLRGIRRGLSFIIINQYWNTVARIMQENANNARESGYIGL